MNRVLCVIVVLVASTAFSNANEDNDNWPCYLKKCGRNDPNLDTCLLAHANRALDSVFAGDDKIGIPSFIPYRFKNLVLGRNRTFTIRFDEAQMFGFQNMHITQISWNFDNKTFGFKLHFNSAVFIDGDYVSHGTFINHPMAGKGHADLIFVGGSQGGNLSYSMTYDLIKVRDKEYVQIKNRECTRAEGFRVDFTNELLTKKQAEDCRQFLNEHSVEFNAVVSEDVQELICHWVDQALNPIFFNFPLDLMFDSS